MKRLGSSLIVHAVIVALIMLLGSVAHSVVKQQYRETLVLPLMDLPAPTVRPIHMVSTSTVVMPSVAKLAIGSPHAPVEEQQPRLVALSLPGSIELPSTPVRVSEAPQVTVGAFGSPTGAGLSGHLIGSVSAAGFGATTGPQGMHAGARVVAAGFSVTPASEPRAVTTRIAPKPSVPVILSEPAAVYSEAARAEHIQGTVDIRVKFRVDGSVEVLGIVNGLPGLNESALAVARGIRFVPGASDFITLIHVRFELS
jgi:outer membrane biosynthesis protein TonB